MLILSAGIDPAANERRYPMKTFTCYYRTGGTSNFAWRRIDSRSTRDLAVRDRDEMVRMGYPAHVEETRLLDSIGLPETYGPA